MTLGLESRTLLLMAGGMYLLLPVGVWLALRQPRELAPRLWCAGGMLGGVGLLLMGQRGQLPDLVTYGLGQPALLLGVLMVAQSLRVDLQRPLPWRLIGLVTVLYGLSLALLVPWVDASVLGTVVRLANLAGVLLLMEAAWAVGRHENSRNARTIAGAYLVQSLAIASNLWTAIQGSDEIQTLASQPVSVGAYMLTLLVALVAGMAYLGLALERSLRRQLTLAAETARAQEWQARQEALIGLDRERLLEVLGNSLVPTLTQPLTAALMRLQLAQRLLGAASPDRALLHENLSHLVQQLHRVGDAIKRIRQFVRPIAASSDPVNLTQVLEHVHKMVQQEAVNRGARLRFHHRSTPLWIAGDALQLAQALLQLLRNALAAVDGQPRRVIKVVLREGADELRVSVIDSGPGLTQAALSSAEASSRARTHPASYDLQGIGLFVVQSIARQHGGRFLLENQPAGGASATLVLPRHRRPPSPHDARKSPDPASRSWHRSAGALAAWPGDGDRR